MWRMKVNASAATKGLEFENKVWPRAGTSVKGKERFTVVAYGIGVGEGLFHAVEESTDAMRRSPHPPSCGAKNGERSSAIPMAHSWAGPVRAASRASIQRRESGSSSQRAFKSSGCANTNAASFQQCHRIPGCPFALNARFLSPCCSPG